MMGFSLFTQAALSFDLSGKPEGFAKLAQKVSPAVVNIYTTKDVRVVSHPMQGVDPFFDQFFKEFMDRHYPNQKRQRTQNSLGSGFIFSADGKVMTNYHVVAGADDVFVNLNGNDKLAADVIGTDAKLDLAVLKIKKPGTYPYVEFGDSDKMAVGDLVLAVGNPFGLGQTVTAGIISAKGRVLGAGPYDNFLQTDASINPGNSGGPLFDMDGKVIGINTAIIASGQGIGFAIPINMAKQVMGQLIKEGHVSRGWLGVSIKDINDDEARVLGVKKTDGVLVNDVVPGGPSDRGGLKLGDVITKINGDFVVNAQTLPSLVAEHQPGETVTVDYLRKGTSYQTKINLGDLDNPNKSFIYPTQSQVGSLGDQQGQVGIDVRDLESSDKVTVKSGVYISAVHASSIAEVVGLKRGDVITAINGEAIGMVGDFKKVLKGLADGAIIKLDVARGTTVLYFAFKK